MKNRKITRKKPLKAAVEESKFDYIQPLEAKPLEVKVYGNNADKAIKAFRTLVQKERVLSVYKDKQSYEKPSDKARRKRNESRRKRLELENKSFSKNKKKDKLESETE
jgi:ribosomal protein S21